MRAVPQLPDGADPRVLLRSSCFGGQAGRTRLPSRLAGGSGQASWPGAQRSPSGRSGIAIAGVLSAALLLSFAGSASSQDFRGGYRGEEISPEVEAMYVKGLTYLVKTQTERGNWQDVNGSGPGGVGVAVLAMLAHGDDPDRGPWSQSVKKGLEFILSSAGQANGYMGQSMYHHGFATLALAEAYGSVDDARLGPALRKAVDLILTSQANNNFGAWRYSPESTDADTTVSGAQMVALFAARNAGLSIPDKAINSGLKFYRDCQAANGGIGYTSAGDSGPIRTAIGCLVFELAHLKEEREFKSAFRFLRQSGSENTQGNYYYYLYYAAQAFFHGDLAVWNEWNARNIKALKNSQSADGSWTGSEGPVFATSAALLSLAVGYRYLPIYER